MAPLLAEREPVPEVRDVGRMAVGREVLVADSIK
jgi:hypothetical protein